MSTEINLFDYRRASTAYRGGTVALSFHGPGTSIVSIHLPVDAEAIVTAFAEAFNAHMAGETPVGAPPHNKPPAFRYSKDAADAILARLNYRPPEHWPNKPLTIEAGKYYRTRDGRRVGPMKFTAHDDYRPWSGWLEGAATTFSFSANGRWNRVTESSFDLIAEWTNTPTPSEHEQAGENDE